MEERILRFIAALRAVGVRISVAESADAFRAIAQLGARNPQHFRLSLQSTLIKNAADLPKFAELYPVFFYAEGAPLRQNILDDLSPEEVRQLNAALQQFNEHLRKMLEKLARGEDLDPAELERLERMVGLRQVDDFRFQNWMVQRMLKALRIPELRQALAELAGLLENLGMNRERVQQIVEQMQRNQSGIEEQLRQAAGQRIAENLAGSSAQPDIDQLMQRPFQSLSDADMDLLRKEVQRLAAILRTRAALRQRRASRGALDAKATLRANLKHGSVPIQLRRRKRVLKPRLVVLCDISTSMRFCSELMLTFLHALQDQIRKTHAFAFINQLAYVTPDLSDRDACEAVAAILARLPAGYYNTDLGHSLVNFTERFLDTLDHRTTLIVVGDGRNNGNNPRADLFRQLARRSRRTVWINPERPAFWGRGDSDMLAYAPLCQTVLQAGNLAELTIAIDKLLDGGLS